MKPPFRDLNQLTAWLDQMTPADRVATCRLLADTHTTGALSAIADAAVWQATRTAKAAEVAEEFGITGRQINRAVTSHNQRVAAAG